MPVIDLNGATAIYRGEVEIEAIYRGAVEIWRKPVINAAALDPANANIMFLPNSMTENLLRDPWTGGTSGPMHPWAAAFRPEYAGAAGTAEKPGYLNEPLKADIASDGTGSRTRDRWDRTESFWSATCDPRRDLAGVDALVLNQYDTAGQSSFGQPYDWSSVPRRNQSAEDVEYSLLFVEAAASAGVSQILIYGQDPFLAAPDNSDDSAWRALIPTYEAALHYMADRVRGWLDDHGHAGIAVRVIPLHRLSARLYDDALAGNIPGGIATHRAFRAGWGEGGGTTHIYMRNPAGCHAMQCLWRYCVFGDLPSAIPSDPALGVDAALAGYFATVAREIGDSYARAGLGGADEGETGLVPYEGEAPAQILATAALHQVDFAASAKFSDRAGTTAAVDGGPVGRIVTPDGLSFTAGSDGARPTLDGEWIAFSQDPMPGALPAAVAPRYVAGISRLAATSSDNTLIRVGDVEVSHMQAGARLGAYLPGDYPSVLVNDWAGATVFWEIVQVGPEVEVRVVNLTPGELAVRTGRVTNDMSAASATITLSSDAWGNPHVSETLLLMVADQAPDTSQRARLYQWLNQRSGLVVW